MIEDDEFEDPNWDPEVEWLGTLSRPPSRSWSLKYYKEDDSPYPEVRSAVSNADDPDMECGTLRAWVIGLILAALISGLNQFFYFRWPSVQIGSVRHLFKYASLLFMACPARRTTDSISYRPGISAHNTSMEDHGCIIKPRLIHD